MTRKRFLIPTLIAAGFLPPKVDAAVHATPEIKQGGEPPLSDLLRLRHEYRLAGHRSHSSHASHSSHRSSSGGGYSAPSRSAPAYSPPSSSSGASRSGAGSTSGSSQGAGSATRNLNSTPPQSVLPSPQAAAPKTLPGNSAKFSEVVRRVQIALAVEGYYYGRVDGLVGPETRTALSKYQRDHGLDVTGTITNQTLDSLNVAAR